MRNRSRAARSYGGWACYSEASVVIYYVIILLHFMQSFMYMLEDVSWIYHTWTGIDTI